MQQPFAIAFIAFFIGSINGLLPTGQYSLSVGSPGWWQSLSRRFGPISAKGTLICGTFERCVRFGPEHDVALRVKFTILYRNFSPLNLKIAGISGLLNHY